MTDEPLVWMTHPGIPGTESQRTSQEAFDLIWEDKGWELIEFGTEPFVPPPHLTLADAPFLRDRANHTGLDSPVTPGASTEVGYAEITADITGIVVDALSIDLVSGLALTIPDLDRPVYVTAHLTVSSNATNAVMAALIAKTSPTPTTILDTVGQMGFTACNATAASKSTSIPFCRLAAHTPCTLQVYLSGAGTATVHSQTYNRTNIRAVTV